MRGPASRTARPDGEQGFTLIEILIVTAVIAVLAALSAQFFTGQYRQARIQAASAQLVSAARAVATLPDRRAATWEAAAWGEFLTLTARPAPAAPTDFRALENNPVTGLRRSPSTNADGVYVSFTRTAETANFTDAGGTVVTILDCPADSLQVAILPSAITVPDADSPLGILSGAAPEFVRAAFEIADMPAVVTPATVARDRAVIACVE